MSSQDTTAVVQSLLDQCGEPLFVLSAFLKVFLAQLELDKPFTGGLGSYKLYVLVASHIISHRTEFRLDGEDPELGGLLISFLEHYGADEQLHAGTLVRVPVPDSIGRYLAERNIEFSRTFQLGLIRQAFCMAYSVLRKQELQRSALALRSDGGGGHLPASALIIGANNNSSANRAARGSRGRGGEVGNRITRSLSYSPPSHAISSSALAKLLDTERLSKVRQRARTRCRNYANVFTDSERDDIARCVLADLQRRLPNSGYKEGTSLEDIKINKPTLAARLRCNSAKPEAGQLLKRRLHAVSEIAAARATSIATTVAAADPSSSSFCSSAQAYRKTLEGSAPTTSETIECSSPAQKRQRTVVCTSQDQQGHFDNLPKEPQQLPNPALTRVPASAEAPGLDLSDLLAPPQTVPASLQHPCGPPSPAQVSSLYSQALLLDRNRGETYRCIWLSTRTQSSVD